MFQILQDSRNSREIKLKLKRGGCGDEAKRGSELDLRASQSPVPLTKLISIVAGGALHLDKHETRKGGYIPTPTILPHIFRPPSNNRICHANEGK